MKKKLKQKLLICLFIFIVFMGLLVMYFNKPKNKYIESINIDEFIIYYINLDRSVKRKENVEKLLKENDLIGNRISAVDGKKIDIDDAKYKKYFKKSKTAYNHYKDDYDTDKKHIGHFGCFLSHMKTYKKFLETNYKYAIIFEDDMEIDNFKNKLNKSIKNVPSDWDIILLQYNIDENKGKNGEV